MAVELNHTIVHARQRDESATFLADILGLASPGSVRALQDRRGSPTVSASTSPVRDRPVTPQHYAFPSPNRNSTSLRSHPRARPRLLGRPRPEPARASATTGTGGRGAYFLDPDGHVLETSDPAIWQRPVGASARPGSEP